MMTNIYAYTVDVPANHTVKVSTYSPTARLGGKVTRIIYFSNTSTFGELTFKFRLGARDVLPVFGDLVAINMPIYLAIDIVVVSGEKLELYATNLNMDEDRKLHVIMEVQE
jgi:hypothetical protein